MTTRIIAEVGVNHNGNIETAFKMVEAAKLAGADLVKFQLFKAEKLVHKEAAVASYQAQHLQQEKTQLEMLKALELSTENHLKLSKHCKSLGIEYLATAFDDESFDFLNNVIKQKKFKIPSGEITNAPFIAKHAETGKELILSTGMSTLSDIENAISVINYFSKPNFVKYPTKSQLKHSFASHKQENVLQDRVTLLHCTSEYPAPMESINLRSMLTISNEFGLPYGYSDHTVGSEVSVAAVAMGATTIEKHFTLDKLAVGPDHAASITPDELKLLVASIRNVEMAMGTFCKHPSEIELENAKVARKSIVASRTIKKGEIFSEGNLTTLRPGTGASPMGFWDLLGQSSKNSYEKGQMINE